MLRISEPGRGLCPGRHWAYRRLTSIARNQRSANRVSEAASTRKPLYRAFIKRPLDVVFSALALFILSPVLGAIALLVRLRLGSPVLFLQLRPGRKDAAGRETLFTICKFRSMTDKRDENGKLLCDEARLTRLGRFLRKTSLDELPELWNILKGDMSVIGPRPQLVRDMVFMTQEQRKRHDVRPGLSGLAQINGRNDIQWEDKLEYDLRYVRRMTFVEDFRIFLVTIGKVFKAESVTFEDMATAEDFGDYLRRSGKITDAEYRLRQQEALTILKENTDAV